MEVTGYREALAGSPYAEQASANVEKLLALAGRRDERGTGGCVAFARELRMLADTDSMEAQADLLDAGDPRAVQLLTIHRAKGLEWPIVVVPALGGRRRATGGRAHVERSHGLALRPWLPDTLEDFRSRRFEAVKEELKAREDAEYRRLLYVALTRARDRLLLSGAAEPRGSKDSWWHLLDARLGADATLRAQVEDVEVEKLPPPADPLPPSAEELVAAEARVEAAVARVRGAREEAPTEAAVATAAALQDFLVCPRRYRYVHQLGLEEGGTAAPLVEADGWVTPLRPAQLVRALLREVDLRQVGAPRPERRAHLEGLLRTLGREPDEEGMEAVLTTVERFLDTAFARRLAEAPVERVHRALSFALALPAADGTEVTVEGEVDLLWETPEGEGVLVALKPGKRHPLGAAAHAHELMAGVLAARRRVPEGVPLRAGVCFLGEASPEPEFLAELEPLEEAAGRLAEATRALARGDARGEWPGQGKVACRALHCGFSEHCHAAPGAC
jgi:ATP-dependent exoDNAse (exonuclease V) beta subunit